MHRPFLLAATLVSTLLLAGCTAEPTGRAPAPGPPALVVEKIRLARLPRHARLDSLAVAADGRAYAVVVSERDGDHVVSTRGTDPPHAAGLLITFVPKSHRFAYWVTEGSGDARTYDLVADGVVHRTGSFLPGPLAFSADGARWATVVFEPAQPIAGAEPTGKIAAVRILTNGEELGRYPDASAPSVSPDGAHVAYLASDDAGRRALYVDGVARRTFEAPRTPCAQAALAAADHPDLAPHHVVRYLDDGRLLVVTRDADGWGVYRDDTRVAAHPISTFDHLDPDCRDEASLAVASIRPAAASGDLFWWERLAGAAPAWRVVKNGAPVDDRTCSEPWRRHPPEVSADGAHVVYPCSTLREGNVREVAFVRDGETLGTFMDVWGQALSANGAHVAFAAADGSPERPWSIFVDGHPRLGGFDAVWRPRVTDDGATVAWQAKRAPKGRGRFGIDARTIGAFDDVLWGPELDGDARIAWVIRRGRTLTRVTAPIALARQPERPVTIVTTPAPGPSATTPASTAS